MDAMDGEDRREDRREDGTVGAEEEVAETFSVGWTEALEQQFGSAPWWLVSVVLHMLVLLALGLVIVSRPPLDVSEVIIVTDLVPPIDNPPVRKPENPFDQPQKHDLKEPVVDDFTLITHEDIDMPDDKMQTDNNTDDKPRGRPEAISDIPLAQEGVVGNIGIDGGGADAWGLNGRGNSKRVASRRIGP
ncbi:MAG: hypothetical protein ACYTKD_04855, partial [Planctomycetota bacterium]